MKSTLAIMIYMAAILAATSAIQKGSDSVAKDRFLIPKTLVERKMAKHKHHGIHAESIPLVDVLHKKHHKNQTAETAEVDVVQKKHHKNHNAETEDVELVQKKHHKHHNETKAEVSESTGKKHHKVHNMEQPKADEIGLTKEPELIEKNLANESGLIEPKHEKHQKNHTKPIGEDTGLMVKKEMGRNGHGPKDSIAAMIEEETRSVSPTTAELEDPTAAVVNQQNSYVSSATKSRIWIFYIAGLLSTIC
jgi:hypothetical protein